MIRISKRWTGKIRIMVWGILISFAMIFASAGAEAMSSQSYQITVGVLGGGGNRSVSASYINQSTIAQVGVLGSKSTSASGLEAFHGFWHAVVSGFGSCMPGDINDDSFLTPEDALTSFHHYLGIIELGGCSHESADINGDGSITPADALCIFQEQLHLPSCLD